MPTRESSSTARAKPSANNKISNSCIIHLTSILMNAINKICIILTIIFGCVASAWAASQDVTMQVGETKTLYLPSSVTSKTLKSVNFYSNGISYVQVVSHTNYSVTVKAIKAFSSPIIVRCDYYYYVQNGGYTYEAKGYYDFNVTVVGEEDTSVKPTKITFSSSAVGVEIGESRQLTPTVYPADAEYTLTWSINDQSVAAISQDGLLTGKSEGSADLTVKADNGVYAMLRVVVSRPSPTSVTVSPATLNLEEGGYTYLSATVYPTTASQSVTWTTSNANVATVSSSGKVTAISAGDCVVKATTSNNRSASCSVHVAAKTVAPTSIVLDKTSAKIDVDGTTTIVATVSPAGATTSITWASSDASVATVANGVVTGISAGECTITASTNNGLLASCIVKVEGETELIEEPTESWEGTYEMHSTLSCAPASGYAYPSDFQMTISKGEDDEYYITSFLGIDCTASYPYTGLRLHVSSLSEATIDLGYSNILGGWSVEGEYLEGLHLLSAYPEYDSLGLGSITLRRNADAELSISDFYVYFFGLSTGYEYVQTAQYTDCASSTEATLSIIDMDANNHCLDIIEVYSLKGECVYKGLHESMPNLGRGCYIIRKDGKAHKVLK